jgi:flagellar protein FliO/FliZ
VTTLGQSASPLSSSPLSLGGALQLTLSLAAVIAFIFALSWALKRMKLAGPRSRGELAVIDQVAVGPKERIVLVRVGESQVLVGLSAGGMVALTPLAVPIAISRATAATPAFADRLREFMKRSGAVE